MKRIIQCPKCEAKLSVFDTGKPISQKCPKCGNSINVESEEPSADDKKDLKSETPAEASATPAKSQPDHKTAPATPVTSTAFDSLPVPEPAGTGGLFKAIVAGALLIIIAMQIITKLNSDKQYKTLIEHLQFIERKLGN